MTSRNRRPMGRGGATVFFSFFLLGGLVFTAILSWAAWENLRTWRWNPIHCEILESGVEERERGDGGFKFVVRFRYEAGGAEHVSETYRPGYGGGGDYGEALRLAERYSAGAVVRAYVSPSDPTRAVLERGSLWMPLWVLFPLIFVAIGGGGIWFTWRRPPVVTEQAEAPDKPIAGTVSRERQLWIAAAFCSVFVLIGIGLLFGWLLPTAVKVMDARSWEGVPAEVISSRVRTHRGSDSDTYSVDILYRYEFGGREYQSNRYDFIGGSSSNHRAKRAIVRQHPPGTQAICYVDPNDPTYAVLNRELGWEMLFGLIPLAFMLFGGAGVAGSLYAIRKARRKRAEGQPDWLPAQAGRREPAGPTTSLRRSPAPIILRSGRGRLRYLLISIGIAIFWNGLVSVFLFGELIPSWREGRPDIFLTIFLIPFVLIGAVLIGNIGYALMAMLNSSVRVTLATDEIRLGEPVQIEWEVLGRHDRLHRLHIYLEGREEATRPGDDGNSITKEVFHTINLVEFEDTYSFGRGRATLRVPEDTMHSFKSANNKIVWSLKVHGGIRFWPDMKDEWEIAVRPMPIEKVQHAGTGH